MTLKPGWIDALPKPQPGISDSEEDAALRVSGGRRCRIAQPGSEGWRKSAKKGAGKNMVKRNLDRVLGKVTEDEE
jgi:hypothetical protein